jgi:hypothetical protein
MEVCSRCEAVIAPLKTATRTRTRPIQDAAGSSPKRSAGRVQELRKGGQGWERACVPLQDGPLHSAACPSPCLRSSGPTYSARWGTPAPARPSTRRHVCSRAAAASVLEPSSSGCAVFPPPLLIVACWMRRVGRRRRHLRCRRRRRRASYLRVKKNPRCLVSFPSGPLCLGWSSRCASEALPPPHCREQRLPHHRRHSRHPPRRHLPGCHRSRESARRARSRRSRYV